MDDEITVIETCGVCGEGDPVSSGAFTGYDGQRVRWALWTCGHGWRSDAKPEPAAASAAPPAPERSTRPGRHI